MKEIIKNTVKKIIIFLILLVIILGINTISTAYSTTTNIVDNNNNSINKVFQNKMPYNHISTPSGMFPQYYLSSNKRNVYIPDNVLNLGDWTATMDGRVVYCSAYGRYVRYGKYDPDIHYIYPGLNSIQGANFNIDGNSIDYEVNNRFVKEINESLRS